MVDEVRDDRGDLLRQLRLHRRSDWPGWHRAGTPARMARELSGDESLFPKPCRMLLRRIPNETLCLDGTIALYRSAGYTEVSRFNDEPYADHWFEKELE